MDILAPFQLISHDFDYVLLVRSIFLKCNLIERASSGLSVTLSNLHLRVAQYVVASIRDL